MVPGGCVVLGGAWSRGVGAWSRGHGPGGCMVLETPLTATAAGGTHPTGMHSCCLMLTDGSISYGKRIVLVTVSLPRHLAGNWRG